MDDPIMQFSSWYKSRPIFTKIFLSSSLILGVLTWFNYVTPYSLYYGPVQAFSNFQVWRPFTSTLFQGTFSFTLMFQLYTAHQILVIIETLQFTRNIYADFIWLLMLTFTSWIAIGSVYKLYFLTDGFLMTLLWVMCRRRPYQVIQIVFLKFECWYFPILWLGFKVFTGGNSIQLLIGVALGELYHTVKVKLTTKYRRECLPTPSLLTKLVRAVQNWQRGNSQWVRQGSE